MTWSRPDWKTDAYSFRGKATSDAHWGWEFLRRWDEYHDAVELVRRGDLNSHQITALKFRFGVSNFVSPDTEFDDSLLSSLCCTVPEIVEYPEFETHGDGEDIDWMDPATIESFRQADAINATLEAESPEELVIKFNVAFDLEPQIMRAKQALSSKKKQLRKLGVITKERVRPEDYRNYLRILDANYSGATDSEIGLVLFPAANQSPRPKDEARRLLERPKAQAVRLLRGGYRFLFAPALT